MTLTRPISTSATRLSVGFDEPVAIQIDLSASSRPTIDLQWLRDQVIRALPLIGRPAGRVSVNIVDDNQMRRLHAHHRGLDETTDVLTFDLTDEGRPIDADIAICIDEAARRSAELNHPIERELLLYIIHGVLHCCGLDDHDEPAAAAMHAEEDRILEAIGVGATYQAPPGGGSAIGERPRP